ncbi:unannotated protein [freshwater metagenome]|uniref:Unannotated protein n=1 Tax=freshwater metagenome TaxID=449393 RepID=A0A6J6CGD0_9ZZZZ
MTGRPSSPISSRGFEVAPVDESDEVGSLVADAGTDAGAGCVRCTAGVVG